MITEELVSYIKSERVGGMSDAEIRANLIVGGEWDKADIEEAFSSLDHPAPKAVAKQNRIPLTLSISAAVIAVLALIFFVFVR